MIGMCRYNIVLYEEINQKADRVAQLLRSQGIKRGDRVAIFLDNSIESVISPLGFLKADAVFLMLSPSKSQLEEFAIPKYLEFRNSLPKNSSGKIDKLILKEEAK